MAKEKMTAACKARLLGRLNRAWSLSDWRFVDVAVMDEQRWMITWRHQVTGEVERGKLLMSELQRAEANNRVGCSDEGKERK